MSPETTYGLFGGEGVLGREESGTYEKLVSALQPAV